MSRSSQNDSRISHEDEVLDPGTPFPEPEVRPTLDVLQILIIGGGAIAGKKAIELFVEQVRNWIFRKGVTTQIEVKSPDGTVIESVKLEDNKMILTLKPIAELKSQRGASRDSRKKKK